MLKLNRTWQQIYLISDVHEHERVNPGPARLPWLSRLPAAPSVLRWLPGLTCRLSPPQVLSMAAPLLLFYCLLTAAALNPGRLAHTCCVLSCTFPPGVKTCVDAGGLAPGGCCNLGRSFWRAVIFQLLGNPHECETSCSRAEKQSREGGAVAMVVALRDKQRRRAVVHVVEFACFSPRKTRLKALLS